MVENFEFKKMTELDDYNTLYDDIEDEKPVIDEEKQVKEENEEYIQNLDQESM